MVKYIITFVAGAVIWDTLKNTGEGNVELTRQTVKLGDKGKDIAAFQNTLNKILGIKHLGQVGSYDNETKAVVIDLFEGTSVLISEDTGELDRQFVLDFNKIFEKL